MLIKRKGFTNYNVWPMLTRFEINIHNEGKLEYVKPLVFNTPTYAACEAKARAYLESLPTKGEGEKGDK